MKKLKELEELLEKNPKVKMLLMYSVENNCTNMINMLTKDSAVADKLKSSLEKYIDYTELTDEEVDEVAGLISSVIKDYNAEKINDIKDVKWHCGGYVVKPGESIQNLGKTYKIGILSDLLTAKASGNIIPILEDVIGCAGIAASKLDLLSCKVLALWIVVGHVLKKTNCCGVVMKNASSYRKKSKKKDNTAVTKTEQGESMEKTVIQLPDKGEQKEAPPISKSPHHTNPDDDNSRYHYKNTNSRTKKIDRVRKTDDISEAIEHVIKGMYNVQKTFESLFHHVV